MMHAINAVQLIRMVTSPSSNSMLGAEIEFGSAMFYVYVGISCFLVIFAGIMSGLTLGLMSLGLVELEILQRSGTPVEKKQAGFRFINSYLILQFLHLFNVIDAYCEFMVSFFQFLYAF